MPLFEYVCPRCGQKQELLVRSADAARAPACPECSVDMEKAWSPVACTSGRGGGGGGGGCSHGGFS
ncbi:MAG: zinc ribbon domain-containing protein [Deltaproteobacteria bacterium]|nr:zinc ribbon domain-containing protein [Deltaproteobacteria bacterium]